jgi:AcrR family transcriptional regulator
MGRASRRDEVLDAAQAIAVEWGVERMTLDAVAERAGVSKGGLFHHFASKDALVEAMARRLLDEFEAAMQAEMAREVAEEDAPNAGRALRAYVRLTTTADDDCDALIFALTTGASRNATVLKIQREFFERWAARLEDDGVDPDVALVVRLAADGCWLSEMFGFEGGLESTVRLDVVRGALLRMIGEAVARANSGGADAKAG